ncbi:ABC transporter permease [Rhodococcus sp. NPDC056743]|uniref:ABC transporter permease n=1 Tax=Rhodococcus sp. NPDC056743 TaxID=3345934 RepID=UPI0036705F82
MALAAAVLLPLIPLQLRAWADGGDGFRRFASMPNLGKILFTTLQLGVGALVVGMVIGTILALCTYTMSPKARSFLEFTPVLPMIVPAVAHVVGFVFLFSPDNGYVNMLLRATPFFDDAETGPINVYTTQWIIFYTGTHLASFVYMFIYTGLRNLGSGYTLAARVNGASAVRALFTVTLPLLRPSFVYAGIMVFLLALGQFTGPLILGSREGVTVLTTRMYDVSSEHPIDYALAAAMGSPLIVLAIFLIIFQRKMLGNQNRFVGEGTSSIDHRTINPWLSKLSASVVIAYVTVAAVLPILALVYVALSPYWSGSFNLDGLTLTNFSTVLSDVKVSNAIVTTLTVSVIGVAIVIPIGMLIALGIYNRDRLPKLVGGLLDVLANLPLTVPAALLGFGFLFSMASPEVGLYGTSISLILAYIIIMIPYSVRYQSATLVAMGRQTVEASQVAGAGPIRTFLMVILPLARAGIVSSAAIMFVLLSHEFAVSLLLRSPGTNVLSVVLYDEYNSGTYPRVAVIALLMTVVTAVGVIVAMLFGGRRALEKL